MPHATTNGSRELKISKAWQCHAGANSAMQKFQASSKKNLQPLGFDLSLKLSKPHAIAS